MLATCASHGPQPAAFVCQHVARATARGERAGFHCRAADAPDARPDAWCDDCDARVRTAGGRWIGQASAELGVTLVCGLCYDKARSLNAGG
jgi:hypothetical protein